MRIVSVAMTKVGGPKGTLRGLVEVDEMQGTTRGVAMEIAQINVGKNL